MTRLACQERTASKLYNLSDDKELYILEIGRQHFALQSYSDLSLIYLYNHNKPHNRTLGMVFIPDDVYMFKSIKGKICTFSNAFIIKLTV